MRSLTAWPSARDFVVSNWLGWLIFLAILLHKAPEGFTMALGDAGQRTQPDSRISIPPWRWPWPRWPECWLFELVPSWLPYGLPISAGVALYVGASDLVPEVNREPGIRMALVFFAGVGGFLLLRMLLPAL